MRKASKPDRTPPPDRTQTIISHIDNVHLSASRCPWHLDKQCFLLLNNFNSRRFHCLYANQSTQWKSCTLDHSCDLPEHFYDLVVLRKELGDEYVLPFSSHFKERSGYTIGLYELGCDLYGPPIIASEAFAENFYTLLVMFCAVSRRLGGNVPLLKHCTFLYTHRHPVLTDLGAKNAGGRERLGHYEFLNAKKWTRFLRRRTTRDVVRYTRVVHPNFFKKKTRKGSKCILAERLDDGTVLDDEVHEMVCKSTKMPLLEVLTRFRHLMPDGRVCRLVDGWLSELDYEEKTR